jgi:hypothetical protein
MGACERKENINQCLKPVNVCSSRCNELKEFEWSEGLKQICTIQTSTIATKK